MHFFIMASMSFIMRTLCNKEFSKRFRTNETNMFFNAISLTTTCVISALMGGMVKLSLPLLILAALFGALFIATVYFWVICLAKGPMGLVSLIFGLSSVVPITVGLTVFHEPMNLYKGLGLLCVLSVVLLSWKDGEAKGSKSKYIPAKVWLPLTLFTTFLNGMLSSIQNMAVQWSGDFSTSVFNFWAFGFGALIGWAIVLIRRLRGTRYTEITAAPRSFWLLSVLCGLGSSGGNILIMYALSYIPSTVCYPLMSTTNTVVIYLLSLFYYKEGRSKYGYLMLAMGIASIVLLSIA